MQVCMDSSDWLKGIVHEEMGMDSSSPSTELISCSRPPSVLERRLRPQHDQAIQCPRCDSTHTKFCYYNNYSLSQPRYFCKTCRRYWTKGGSLRNVPVGGGCRKNKRSSNKKPMMDRSLINPQQPNISCFHNETDLHLSFPGMHLPHHETMPEGFAECKYHLNGLDLMESSRSHFLMGEMGLGDSNPSGFHGLNQLGFQGNHGTLMEACQRLSIPFEDPNSTEVKSVDRMLLPIEWQELGCAEVGRGDSFGYSGGFGMWTGMINGKHGPSAAI